MKITICGSMHHIDGMLEAKKTLEKMGYEIETPDLSEKSDSSNLSDKKRAAKKDGLIRQHLDKIADSDAIFIYNEEKRGVPGYVGGNSLMEMAFAYAQGIEIFLQNEAREMSYADEIYGMQPIILNGDIKIIDDYFNGLSKTLVSSKSPIKLQAVSRGMRKAGIRTQVLPRPTESNVAAQPRNIEETYEGAQNRHKALKLATVTEKPAYFATVESGLFNAHSDHNTFSSTVVILEPASAEPKAGINVELEYPKNMTDKVPSQYPDLGELVQAEYGSTLKDPFPYFTNGKVNRLMLVEAAVFNVAVQLEVQE